MRLHDVWRKTSRWDSIQNHDRLIDFVVSFRTFVFLTIIQQKSKLVQMNDASQMRHIDFQFKRADRHENVKLSLDDEALHDDLFVLDLSEIRFTFDRFRSEFDVLDSIAVHHHFLVRQQMSAMTLNHDQQFSLLYLRCQKSRTSRTISNVCSRDEIFEKFDLVRFHAHYLQKSNFI